MQSCLDEDTILDFVAGRLSAEAIQHVEQHADRCPVCFDVIGAAGGTDAQELGEGGTAMPPHGTIGSYRLLEMIGHGGMGVVYRAVHAASGQRVALKTVRSEARGALASIRREVQVLNRLRHPGVVRILDHGLDGQHPWYAMDFVEGRTLEQHFVELHPGRPSSGGAEVSMRRLAETLGVLRRLCGTLSFLHGLGVVHRDLKPQNVVLRADGTPILVDFGLALRDSHPGRALFATGAHMGGTILYMAPEQIRGEILDPRADLYALGCILYEALTGRPPFHKGTTVDVALKHLREVPAPPSSLVPDIDPALERLVLCLLEKVPQRRIGYAEDVAEMLVPFSGPSADVGLPRARPYVYRPEFIGRTGVLDDFGDRLRQALEGHGSQVFVAGESGVGKTRLIAEIANRAREAGFRVVIGEGVPLGAHPTGDAQRSMALHPFRPLLQTLVDVCDGSLARSESIVGPHGRLLAPYEPSLLHLPGQDAYLDLLPVPAHAARERLLLAMHETIARLADEKPLLLVLDDLQWADELSLDVIERADLDLFARHRILIVGAYRSDESTERLERIVQAPGVELRSLGNFDAATVERMVQAMLALGHAPPPLQQHIVVASGGNPFFVAEYLRAAVDEGWLVRDIGARWRFVAAAPGTRLPGSLRELLDLRLAALSGPARHLLDVASVLGREQEGYLLARIAALTESESAEGLRELGARALLEELPGDRFRFAHERVREAAYGTLTTERRRDLHGHVATAIERQLRVSGLVSLHPVLAYHWALAEKYEHAVTHSEIAGELAMEKAAHAEAASLFGRALDLERTLRDRGEPLGRERVARWERRLGEACYALGDLQRADKHASNALRGFGHPLPQSRVGWGSELVAQIGRQVQHLVLPARDVERAPARSTLLQESALAAARVAHGSYFAEDGLRLITTALLAVNLAERATANGPVALPYAQLGYLAGMCRLRGLAARYFGRARRSAEAANDLQELAVALAHESLLHAGNGRFEQAERLAQRALDHLAGVRSPQENEVVWIILSHVDLCVGRYDAAIDRGSQLLGSARARANRQHQAFGRYAIARALIRLDRFDDAIEHLVEARSVMPAEPLCESICSGLLAVTFKERGALDEAEGHADAAMAAIKRAHPSPFSLADGYDGASEVYLDLWRRARYTGSVVPPSLPERAARGGAAMRKFAVFFPIGRPRYLLHVGRVLALQGRPRSAARVLTRGRALALQLGMPYEAKCAERLLEETIVDNG